MSTFAAYFGFMYILYLYNIKTGYGLCSLHVCYNCTVKCLNSYVVEQDGVMSKLNCIGLINNTTVKAVEYTNENKCLTTNTFCVTYNELRLGSISYTYRCTEGCSLYALSGQRFTMVSDTPDMDFVTSKDICIEYCIRTNRFVFDTSPNGPTCRAFGTCENNYSCSYERVQEDVIALNRTCITQECNPPKAPLHGSVEFNLNVPLVYGEVAVYSCNPGYWLLGAASSICGTNGAWSTLPPLCIPVMDNTSSTSSSLSSGITSSSTHVGSYSSVSVISTIQSSTTMSFPATSLAMTTSTTLAASASSSTMSIFATSDISATPTLMSSSYSPTSSLATLESSPGTTTAATTAAPSTNPPAPNITKFRAIYISPCLCYNQTRFANLTTEEIIPTLIKEMAVNPKMTSLSKNKLLSMPDSRLSAKIIGLIGGAVLVGCGLICLSCDLFTYVFKCEVKVKKKK